MLREETNSDSKQVKILIHNYLDPELLKPMKVTEGIGFHLTKPGEQREVHVTVLTISYQDKKIAQKMSERTATRSNYFRNTKILTIFSCMVVDNKLLIAFTEQVGDDELVQFVKSIPDLFKH
ncbi:hypothetical protein AGMMS49545_00810 [Betaproteobacteria bacterium]|nr:hypothetical protein AGMMS49545_00810 [Betaproteobacteria bacterium]